MQHCIFTTFTLIFWILNPMKVFSDLSSSKHFIITEACAKNSQLSFCESEHSTVSNDTSTIADESPLASSAANSTSLSPEFSAKSNDSIITECKPKQPTLQAFERQDLLLPAKGSFEVVKSTTEPPFTENPKPFGDAFRNNVLTSDSSSDEGARNNNKLVKRCLEAYPYAVRVDIGYGISVNGIPYYPINEEGAVGVQQRVSVPFGAYGGGYSGYTGVRDYWSQHAEAGANWIDGLYGYKSGWSVPLVQSLGIEGYQGTRVGVPLDQRNFGKIGVDTGLGVGGYYAQNDHTGVDWREGNVNHQFGVGVPFAGVGVNTGTSVSFPSLNTWLRAFGP